MKVGDVVWYANKLRKKGVSPKLSPNGEVSLTRMHNEILAEVQLLQKEPQFTGPFETLLFQELAGLD